MNLSLVASSPLDKQGEMAVSTFITNVQSAYADELHGVVLYGSKARSEATADSDIDLLLIMQSDDWSIRDDITRIASQISLAFDLLISTHVVSLSRWQAMVDAPFSFYKSVFAEGMPLFGPSELFEALAWDGIGIRETA